jgi:putative addiction module component (TIGR02574 family)
LIPFSSQYNNCRKRRLRSIDVLRETVPLELEPFFLASGHGRLNGSGAGMELEMNVDVAQLTNQALSLPVAQRVQLAQKLWESLPETDENISPVEEAQAVELARQRDAQLNSGEVPGIPHDQVMQDARRSIGCE